MLTKMETHHERMMARMNSQLEKMEARLGKIEATSLEAEHKEIPKEEAAVETFGTLKEQYEDQHLAVRRHSQPKKRTQGSGGSQKKLAAAYRGMTRHARMARRKGHGHEGQGKDSVVQGTRKGRTFEKRCQAQLECNNAIKN
jgi:hypothetical protein